MAPCRGLSVFFKGFGGRLHQQKVHCVSWSDHLYVKACHQPCQFPMFFWSWMWCTKKHFRQNRLKNHSKCRKSITISPFAFAQTFCSARLVNPQGAERDDSLIHANLDVDIVFSLTSIFCHLFWYIYFGTMCKGLWILGPSITRMKN